MTNIDDDDPDYEDRKEEIKVLRARISRFKGEDPERDKLIDEHMGKTKGDTSHAGWRAHVRFFESLKTPIEKTNKEKKTPKKKSGFFDF